MRRQIKMLQPRLITASTSPTRPSRDLRRNRAIIPVGGMAELTWRLERYLPSVGRALHPDSRPPPRAASVPQRTAG